MKTKCMPMITTLCYAWIIIKGWIDFNNYLVKSLTFLLRISLKFFIPKGNFSIKL